MAELNRTGLAHARSLISTGKVDKASAWSFDASDGNALLGSGDDWAAYGAAHLGVDTSAKDKTKARWKYPFEKSGKLYRSAIVAIRSRAGQQKDSAIEDAAGSLLEAIDGKKQSNSLGTPALELERRAFVGEGLKIERRDDKMACLRGHAAVFNQLSEDLGGFREQIAPGAFTEALGSDDVRALFNHDPNFVLGRTAAKTLRLAEDSRGLAFECDVPDTQMVRDLVLAPIDRGDISHMSFQFAVKPNGQDWAQDDEGRNVRTLKRVKLFDVSPVTYPAYPQTDVALRELRSFIATQQPPAPVGTPNLVRARQLLAQI